MKRNSLVLAIISLLVLSIVAACGKQKTVQLEEKK